MPAESQSIRAVTFDLDDTLWDIWPIIARAEQQLHDWLVAHYPRIPERFTALNLRDLAAEIAEQQPQLAHDRTLLRKQALQRAARLAGYRRFEVDRAFAIFFAARNEIVFFEEVLPVLERLAQRYTLAALTNGNADIDRIGLSRLFDFSISAEQIGAAKPAAAMFQAACRKLDMAPSQIVHVGDDPEGDVLGAARAGLRTVWVNRNNRSWPGGPPADAEIRTLEELEVLLTRWK